MARAVATAETSSPGGNEGLKYDALSDKPPVRKHVLRCVKNDQVQVLSRRERLTVDCPSARLRGRCKKVPATFPKP